MNESFARRLAFWVVGLCLLVLTTTAGLALLPAARSWVGLTPDAAAPSYVVGDHVDVPRETYAASQRTLLVFAEGECGACQASKPVLTTIAAELRAGSVPVVLITGQRAPAVQREFAQELGLSDAVWSLDLTMLKVRRVPTVLVVDANGQVLYSKEGLLADEDRVAIRGATASPGTL